MKTEPGMVCLFRCKECGARLFEHDAPAHAKRHGFDADKWRPRFVRGKRDTWARPGMNHQPLNAGRTPKKKNISFGQGEKSAPKRIVKKAAHRPEPRSTALRRITPEKRKKRQRQQMPTVQLSLF